MEVVLQWLDEIEDAVFTIALVWEPVRKALLQVGLYAALTLYFALSAAYWPVFAGPLAGVAFASVVVWLASFAIASLARAARPRPAAA